MSTTKKKILDFHIITTSVMPAEIRTRRFLDALSSMIFTGNFAESRLHVVAFEGHHEITVLLEVHTINLITVVDIALYNQWWYHLMTASTVVEAKEVTQELELANYFMTVGNNQQSCTCQ